MGRVPPPARGISVVRNVRLFDGKDARLRDGLQVIVGGNQIVAIEPAAVAPPSGAAIIDGGGRVLMPGLLDAHYHTMFAALPSGLEKSETLEYITLVGAEDAEAALLRGYTSVRDLGGASFGLKRAIDEGRIAGPRIFPSGLALSQTSGHGDLRDPSDIELDDDGTHRFMTYLADGADAVLKGAREQLFMGASQIKLLAGGGIVSLRDPLDSLQYGAAELRAAVEAAADWGTYVTVHAYMPDAIKRAIRAGVRCIEHGQLADEDAAKMMRDADVWWSIQPFVPAPAVGLTDPRQIAKRDVVVQGTNAAYRLAKKYDVRTAFGTDFAFNPKGAARQSVRLASLANWFTPVAALRHATSETAGLFALSGPRNPYPEGSLGVIEPRAYADLLLVDGEPLQNLELFLDPEANLRLIMKDGRIFKNTL